MANHPFSGDYIELGKGLKKELSFEFLVIS